MARKTNYLILLSTVLVLIESQLSPYAEDATELDDEEDYIRSQQILQEKLEELSEQLQMTTTEYIDIATRIFNKGDVDGDGELSADETNNLLHSLVYFMEDKKNKDNFNTVDTDGNGKIDKQEFVLSYFETDEIDEKELSEAQYHLGRRFDAIDVEGDGYLVPDEFNIVHRPFRHPLLAEIEVQDIIDSKDMNRDNKISFEEFIEGVNPEEKESAESEFNAIDKNKDMMLDKEEVLTFAAHIQESEQNAVLSRVQEWMDGGSISRANFPSRVSLYFTTWFKKYQHLLNDKQQLAEFLTTELRTHKPIKQHIDTYNIDNDINTHNKRDEF
eukprot:GHVR01002058.1.p1 GENE.GHVR01002058.1~~GHVR01002058.1.p1  ORF type:complete len:346 (-),score=94.55 GHVR01002058.1:258-1244(-)